jgi:hypothetical protein
MARTPVRTISWSSAPIFARAVSLTTSLAVPVNRGNRVKHERRGKDLLVVTHFESKSAAMSETSQTWSVTPVAIAGVTRRVL